MKLHKAWKVILIFKNHTREIDYDLGELSTGDIEVLRNEGHKVIRRFILS